MPLAEKSGIMNRMFKASRTFKPRQFKDPKAAYDAVREIYETHVEYLREHFRNFPETEADGRRFSANYPYVKVKVNEARRVDTRLSYGFVYRAGTYTTTLTRPDIFDHYLLEQFRLLLLNHEDPLEIGVSSTPIPIHFALGDDTHIEHDLSEHHIRMLPRMFDMPDLSDMDDEIANNTYIPPAGQPEPLSLFSAPRTDLSLLRLRHYCGTSANHFQNYIIFTNYQFYIDEFIRICHDIMSPAGDVNLKKERAEYSAFVEPGNVTTVNRNLPGLPEKDHPGVKMARMPQMPAYHLKRKDGSGITMINIGVGPSNAKTITDHVAVLRPHAWLMLGHCAGLRNSQKLGDYVLAHGYLRNDHVLDQDLPPEVPIPALSEIQLALEDAVAKVTGLNGYDLKKVMRTGTVATVDDRNWELRPVIKNNVRLSQSRAIALDMESATIAANGYRFRVPYGTLLCISDKPLHGQPKLPGMADAFYRERVNQHLQIGLLTMTLLRGIGHDRLHSRKLRSFNEVAFQ